MLSREEEARYGYLAAVNSTTLADGVALDIGGGSMQLTRVARPRARDARSWRLGAVVMTERFLAGRHASSPSSSRRCARTCARSSSAARLAAGATARRLAGIGGTVRNLAAAVMLARGAAVATASRASPRARRARRAGRARSPGCRPRERRQVPGIKPERGDLILAGAVVVQTVMESAASTRSRSPRPGCARACSSTSCSPASDAPLFDDVRARRGAQPRRPVPHRLPHTEHVARLALEIWDGLAGPGCTRATRERELLWAAAMLHDIGTAVDYDDHHKHSRYLILNAGLPGFSPRETALIGQMARYHRKG